MIGLCELPLMFLGFVSSTILYDIPKKNIGTVSLFPFAFFVLVIIVTRKQLRIIVNLPTH